MNFFTKRKYLIFWLLIFICFASSSYGFNFVEEFNFNLGELNPDNCIGSLGSSTSPYSKINTVLCKYSRLDNNIYIVNNANGVLDSGNFTTSSNQLQLKYEYNSVPPIVYSGLFYEFSETYGLLNSSITIRQRDYNTANGRKDLRFFNSTGECIMSFNYTDSSISGCKYNNCNRDSLISGSLTENYITNDDLRNCVGGNLNELTDIKSFGFVTDLYGFGINPRWDIDYILIYDMYLFNNTLPIYDLTFDTIPCIPFDNIGSDTFTEIKFNITANDLENDTILYSLNTFNYWRKKQTFIEDFVFIDSNKECKIDYTYSNNGYFGGNFSIPNNDLSNKLKSYSYFLNIPINSLFYSSYVDDNNNCVGNVVIMEDIPRFYLDLQNKNFYDTTIYLRFRIPSNRKAISFQLLSDNFDTLKSFPNFNYRFRVRYNTNGNLTFGYNDLTSIFNHVYNPNDIIYLSIFYNDTNNGNPFGTQNIDITLAYDTLLDDIGTEFKTQTLSYPIDNIKYLYINQTDFKTALPLQRWFLNRIQVEQSNYEITPIYTSEKPNSIFLNVIGKQLIDLYVTDNINLPYSNYSKTTYEFNIDVCEYILEIPTETETSLGIFRKINLRICNLVNSFSKSDKMCLYFGYLALIFTLIVSLIVGIGLTVLIGDIALSFSLLSFSITNIFLNKVFLYSNTIKIFIGLMFAIGIAILIRGIIFGHGSSSNGGNT